MSPRKAMRRLLAGALWLVAGVGSTMANEPRSAAAAVPTGDWVSFETTTTSVFATGTDGAHWSSSDGEAFGFRLSGFTDVQMTAGFWPLQIGEPIERPKPLNSPFGPIFPAEANPRVFLSTTRSVPACDSADRIEIIDVGYGPAGVTQLMRLAARWQTGCMSGSISFGATVPVSAYLPSVRQMTFSIVDVGGAVNQTVRIENRGTGPLPIRDIYVDGFHKPDYRIVSNGCPPTVEAGDQCSASVEFRPRARGLRAARLRIDMRVTAFDVDQSIELSGSASGPGLAPLPRSFFLDQTLPNDAVVYELDSDGRWIDPNTETLYGTLPAFAPVAGERFTIGAHPAGTYRYSGSTEPFEIATNVLEATYDDEGTPTHLVIELGGPTRYGVFALDPTIGVPSRIVTAQPIDFGWIVPDGAPVHRSVTVTNNGDAPIDLYAPTFAGADTRSFTLGTSSCPIGTLAAKQSCRIDVVGNGSVLGRHTANLVLGDSIIRGTRTGSPIAIELTVTGLPNMTGGEFVNLPPTRILDTRDGNGRAKSGPMTENETTVLQVAGRGGVPPAAKAVAVNITADASTTGGWISVFPAASGFQGTSSVNFAPNETAPNMVFMALDNDGRLGILNCCGTTTVIVDVLGWITDDKAVRVGGRMAPIVPFRMADTRSTGQPLGPGEIRSFQMEPMKGIVINLTAIDATADTYLTVFEEGVPLPIASNLNVAAGANRANVAIAPVSTGGRISVYNARGTVHVAIDRLATITQNDEVVQTTAGRIVTGTPQRLFDTRKVQPIGTHAALSFDMGHLECPV
jgi:hypothetical protein